MKNVMVSIRDLYKSFGKNQVLKGVSFDVEKDRSYPYWVHPVQERQHY